MWAAIVVMSGVTSLPGWATYDRMCSPCHGAEGDGHGPAAPWLAPEPRDFTRGAYEWRTVGGGVPPTRDDLATTIRYGVPGAMPAFGDALDDRAIDQVIDVIATFSPDVLIGKSQTRGHAKIASGGDVARGAELWKRNGCVSCHGPEAPKRYDLSTTILRRPRASAADEHQAIADDIVYGLDGAAMPGYASIDPDDLASLIAFLDTIRSHSTPPSNASAIAQEAIERDRRAKIDSGRWPGGGAPDEALLFGAAIAPQGDPPSSLAPAQASLNEQQCARCHAKQAREWSGTIHSQATSPGVLAQFPSMSAHEVEGCSRCHAPLAEQRDDEPLRAQAVTCAACHVRAWTRHGPPQLASSLIPIAGYPLVQQSIYERGDFCLPCHQLPARLAVEGRPLLDTYREWLFGPYMRRGVQCQHCHMPNREHTWKGVHDPDTFRQGIRVEAIAARGAGGAVSVRARVWNQGAGHFLPTTPTPAAWITIELFDDHGRAIRGARATKRIGRAIRFEQGAWHQLEDTRIPPGESLELAGAWIDGRVAEATTARVTIDVHPDDYYEGFYREKLAAHADPQYQAALDRALASHYEAYRRDVPLR
ncbi:MAG TPA: c-type cytochrome [Kofleriaceae bacterium]|nr:c-type cytochrome [Kofleriaceae bacterium]